MATAQLTASSRSEIGKGNARALRRSGKVPGVVYGHARQAQSLAIPTREFERLLEHISAENTVVELLIDGKASRTLIREIQRHPFKREILHVDFQELVAGEKVAVRVPLVLVGTAEGVKTGGGLLDQTLRDVEIEVDPINIPTRIEVNVEALNIGDSIHLRDVAVPPGVEVLTDLDASVCVCEAPRAAIEAAAGEAAAGTEAPAEPEVIRKAKTEDEEKEE